MYNFDFLKGTFTPSFSILILGNGEISGVAWLRPWQSAKGCEKTLKVITGMDLSDIEFASPPYTTEVIEAP